MSSPEEIQLGHDLSELTSGQPFLPDIEAIGQRARQRHRRGLVLRAATAAGAAVLAVGGLFVAVHSTGGSNVPVATASHVPAAESPLVSLAANISASSGPLPGNASLIIRTQTIGDASPEVTYNLYTDGGAYYYGDNKTDLLTAIAQNDNIADGMDAREVAAARYAATGALTVARERMINATPNTFGLGLSPAARYEIWKKAVAREAPMLRAKGFKIPTSPPTGKALQSELDNWVWNNSVDALTEGGGDPQVRAGVLRLISTISAVTVVSSTTDGQATLTLTAGPEVFGGAAEQILTVNARTGMPIKSVDPAQGTVPMSVDTYQVSRVTLAHGKF
jgi:hypothetical protein